MKPSILRRTTRRTLYSRVGTPRAARTSRRATTDAGEGIWQILMPAPGHLARAVERFAVVGAHRDAGPSPFGVGGDEAVVIDRQLGIEGPALVSIGELVEPGIRLCRLHDREVREAEPGCLDLLRSADAEAESADRQRIGRRTASKIDI